MTDETLLSQFVGEEFSKAAFAKLLADMQECSGTQNRRSYTFNRFNIHLDFESEIALIEDDLNPDENGEMELHLSDFRSALKAKIKSDA